MGIAPIAGSLVNGLGGTVEHADEPSKLPQRGPEQSEIRDLGGLEFERAQSFVRDGRRETVAPPPLTLDAAAEHYGRLASANPDVMRSLQVGDLPRAIIILIQENFLLRKQNASWQSDFEELRSANIAQQEDADTRLAVADDERLQLIDQLERARSELVEIESQAEQARRDYEDDLEALRQQRDALQQELFELKTRG